MIPAEAVEAARAIILPYVDDEHFDLSDIARAALEAAAPHMQRFDRDELRKLLDAGSPHHRSANDAELDALVEAIIAAGWHL